MAPPLVPLGASEIRALKPDKVREHMKKKSRKVRVHSALRGGLTSKPVKEDRVKSKVGGTVK